MKYLIALVITMTAIYAHSSTRMNGQLIGNPMIAITPAEECLALNVYYEARSDNLAGKYAVADVVLNRVKDTRYPNTICAVVKQGKMGTEGGTVKLNVCQFSWYCDGKSDTPNDEDSWQKAQMIAYNVINHRKFVGITEGSTHYHATFVDPYWVSELEFTGTIGQHLFYRWE